MAIDTSRGMVEQFEDFLVTAIADLPEIDFTSGNTATEVVAGAADGRLRLTQTGTDDDDTAIVTFGALNWTAGVDLDMEARIFISAVSDFKMFVGFGDSAAAADETTFSATTDTVTIDTQSDAIGILFDGDATTKNFWAVAGATDVVTVSQVLPARLNAVADTAITIGVHVGADRKSARWYINGEEVHRVNAAANAIIAAVDLVPGVWTYDQGVACNIDVDYIWARKPRATS